MMVVKDICYCETCRTFTNHRFLEEFEDLVIVGNDSLSKDYECLDCHRTNRRILHKCFSQKCDGSFTQQVLLAEKPNELMSGKTDQKFKCYRCDHTNITSRESDDSVYQFLNGLDDY